MKESFQNYAEERRAPPPEISKENYYNLSGILKEAYEHKYEMEKNGGKPDFNFYRVDIGNRHLVRDATQFVLIDTDNTNDARPERLQAILEEICRDQTLVRDMKKLVSLHKILEGDIEKFSERMRILSEKIQMRVGE